MHVVAIYNNKGGVGKSTLTVGLAEFLAGNRGKRVLVIDLDAQASSSGSILGRPRLNEAIRHKQTIAELGAELRRSRKRMTSAEDFFVRRPAAEARGTALSDIAVLVPNKPGILELEEQMSRRSEAQIFKKYLRPALEGYDFVLIDLPSNVDRRNTVVVNGLTMSDFVLIPVEPSQISLNALPDTFELIDYARNKNRGERPAIIGMVCNKTDRRSQQYRSKFPEIIASIADDELPPLFQNILPDTPKLATATDETIDFHTLKERFGSYYDNVRKVARELERRCSAHTFQGPSPSNGFARKIRGILDRFAIHR